MLQTVLVIKSMLTHSKDVVETNLIHERFFFLFFFYVFLLQNNLHSFQPRTTKFQDNLPFEHSDQHFFAFAYTKHRP